MSAACNVSLVQDTKRRSVVYICTEPIIEKQSKRIGKSENFRVIPINCFWFGKFL